MWEAIWEILSFTLFYSVQLICIVSFAKKNRRTSVLEYATKKTSLFSFLYFKLNLASLSWCITKKSLQYIIEYRIYFKIREGFKFNLNSTRKVTYICHG